MWIAVGLGFWVLPEATRRAAAGRDPREVLLQALAVIAVLVGGRAGDLRRRARAAAADRVRRRLRVGRRRAAAARRRLRAAGGQLPLRAVPARPAPPRLRARPGGDGARRAAAADSAPATSTAFAGTVLLVQASRRPSCCSASSASARTMTCGICSGPLRLRYRGDAPELVADAFAPSCHSVSGYADLYACERCGTVQQPDLPSGAELHDLYRGMRDDAYLAEEAGRRVTARRLLDAIERHAPRGRMLEVGCGHGLLLDEARAPRLERRGARARRRVARARPLARARRARPDARGRPRACTAPSCSPTCSSTSTTRSARCARSRRCSRPAA